MNILGFHSGHDASLALIKNDRLVAAVAMERYTGIKKHDVIRKEDLDRFLWDNDITLEEIDFITTGYWEASHIPFMKIYSPEGKQYPLSWYGKNCGEVGLLNHLDVNPLGRNNWKPEYVEGLGYTLPDVFDRIRPPYGSTNFTHRYWFDLIVTIEGCDKVFWGAYVDHQTSHASAAFYTSPFEECVVFTADATGKDETSCSLWSVGKDVVINPFKNPGYMYGNFYDCATEYCGLGPGLIKAGVLMGLAAYGDVSLKTKQNWEEWTKPSYQRDEIEDNTYIDWLFAQISGKYPHIISRRPEIESGSPDAHMYTREFQWVYTKEQSTTKEVMDVAADVQYMAERSLVKYTQELYEQSKGFNGGNLCVSGGLFLNCNANYKILNETGFERIHFFPACGDDGISVGSALYALHHIFRKPRVTYEEHELMYMGYEYPYQPESEYVPQDLDLDVIAEAISESKIICWYQGKGEIGPRALGNRSFITDPRNPDMKDILNSRVKFREWFRPFAPVVLNEHKEEWFKMDFESPYMLHTVPCKKPHLIPSAVHIDNTARVQTIRRDTNEKFYDLIEKFYYISGVPVVMNTSLNIKGQPIVETPEQAMELFKESDVDVLVINDKMYFK